MMYIFIREMKKEFDTQREDVKRDRDQSDAPQARSV